MEHHDTEHHRARCERVCERHLVGDQVPVVLQVPFQQLQVCVQRAETILRVLAHDKGQAKARQDDAANGREEVGIRERQPFENRVVVIAGAAEKSRFRRLRTNYSDGHGAAGQQRRGASQRTVEKNRRAFG